MFLEGKVDGVEMLFLPLKLIAPEAMKSCM